jgi:hypothetical protein
MTMHFRIATALCFFLTLPLALSAALNCRCMGSCGSAFAYGLTQN